MLEAPASASNSVRGRLEVDALFREGQTRLDKLYHSVPFHVSKPYWDGSVLLLQVASPTAGLFSGDHLGSKVRVKGGAALLVTNQGASRIHPRTGGDAVLEQHFEVFEGGWLEVFPELIIPHKGAALTMQTVVDVAGGGRLYFAEMLAPGRTASGETYAYEKLDWRFRLNLDGCPLVLERAEITAATAQWMFARPPGWHHLYYGCVWIVADELGGMTESDFGGIEELSDADRLLGVSRLAPEAIVVKVVARSAIPLRDALRSVRSRMSDILPNLKCNPRKL